MFLGEGLLGVLLLGFWLFCIIDVISSDETLCRNLPKLVWLFLVVVLPDVGGICWLALGRPQRSDRPSRSRPEIPRRARRSPVGPEDSTVFLAEIEREARRLRESAERAERRPPPQHDDGPDPRPR